MAAPLTPNQLIDALEKFNVPYELYPDWKTRKSGGANHPIGFIIHHTAGPYTESSNYLDFLFNRGRPGIPGPLCNFSIGPSGTVYVGSLGNANHAGRGSWRTRQLVGAESYNGYSDEINPGPDDYGTGNDYYWGVEINYPGTSGNPMRSAQYQSAVLLSAALMDAWGWSPLSTIGHREHSRRKIDPGGVNMAKFRRDVRDAMGNGGISLPTPREIWGYENESQSSRDAWSHVRDGERILNQRVEFGENHWSVEAGIMAKAKYHTVTALRNIWAHAKHASMKLNSVLSNQEDHSGEIGAIRDATLANTALLEAMIDRDPNNPLTGEEVRTIMREVLLEADGRIINVDVTVDDNTEDTDGETPSGGVEPFRSE